MSSKIMKSLVVVFVILFVFQVHHLAMARPPVKKSGLNADVHDRVRRGEVEPSFMEINAEKPAAKRYGLNAEVHDRVRRGEEESSIIEINAERPPKKINTEGLPPKGVN
ncbi:uncharacterized protein [Antedon mediterranea]|uniref:uncharacterized protein isoform X2 n=1 Tax=Antedon mediterranea TaxID=105859 RepID=UPI003AF968B4